MLEAIISTVSSFERTCAIARGENQHWVLDRTTTRVERLSDKILYAPDLQAITDVNQTRQHCVSDLREVREALDPVQRAIDADILSSAMILTPEKMQQVMIENPWKVLMDIRPVSLFSAKIPTEGVPILFEHEGLKYLGWQMRGILPVLFQCHYNELWLSSLVQDQIILPTDVGQMFTFETVVVDKYGHIVQRLPKQGWMQVEDLGGEVVLEMIYIPGGTFLMGAPVDEINSPDSERPQHQVTLPPFYMSKYPVTQAQWQAIMGNNPAHFKGDNRPVEMISRHDSVTFCQKLSKRTGQYYHLPSEEQWEYACRAGTTTAFSYGDTITTDLANYDGNRTYAGGPKGKYRQETTPVSNFPPNAWGLHDMHGNVWEWCQDVWHDNYACAPNEGDCNLKGVFRGGSWCGFPRWLRSAYRYGCALNGRYDNVGVRIVRTV